jgi:hypothetical protein
MHWRQKNAPHEASKVKFGIGRPADSETAMSAPGPTRTSGNVRFCAAHGGKADIQTRLIPHPEFMSTRPNDRPSTPQPSLVPVSPRYSRKKSIIVRSSRTSIGPMRDRLSRSLVSSLKYSREHRLSHRQGLEAVTAGIEDGVQKCGNHGNHHDFRHALWRLVRQWREHLDLEPPQR